MLQLPERNAGSDPLRIPGFEPLRNPGSTRTDTEPTRMANTATPEPALSQVRGRLLLVGDTGLEPVTSSVSRKRASQTAPIARAVRLEVETGFEPVYTALQAVASPLGHSTVKAFVPSRKARKPRADNETRTRDPNLGKVVLYQLSYVRTWPELFPGTPDDIIRSRRAESNRRQPARSTPQLRSGSHAGVGPKLAKSPLRRFHRRRVRAPLPRGTRRDDRTPERTSPGVGASTAST